MALYDDQGRLTGFRWDGEGETAITEITYDEHGRIVAIQSPDYPGAENYSIATYQYDDQGNMIREEKRCYNARMAFPEEVALENCVIVTEYTYDAQGVLLNGVRINEHWSYGYFDQGTGQREYGHFMDYKTVDQYTFQYDDSGRMKSILIENGDSYYMIGEHAGQIGSEAPYDFTQIEVIYGTYWFFDGK